MSEYMYKASDWGALFHSLPHHEALGAGAAGPGKSLVLLFDPIDQLQTEHARCEDEEHKFPLLWGQSTGWALHLRREAVMLDQTLERAALYFPSIDPDVKFDKETKKYTFSCGYKYQFGHCKDPGDWQKYLSNQYCSAKGTEVLMEDGSFKAIELIIAGDIVQTLEGPKPVVATWYTGVKPCVEMDVLVQGVSVGKQRFPTTHPVLLSTTDESQTSPSQDTRQEGLRARPHGLFWQDFESLLSGLPESPERRVSRVDERGCFAASDGSLLVLSQLPALTVRIALHEPTLRKALSVQPTQSNALSRLTESCEHASQAQQRLLSVTTHESQKVHEYEKLSIPDGADCRFCGGAYAPHGQGIPTDSTARCLSCTCLRGEQPLLLSSIGAELTLLLDDVATRIRSYYAPDAQESVQTRSQTETCYPHFYSGKARHRSEALRTETAELRYCGNLSTYDLTVHGSNHYVTKNGAISAQTWIGFDELTQFEKEQYMQICTRLRSADPVLRHMLKIRAMSNPFCAFEGSTTVKDVNWVRERFVDPAPEGKKTIRKVIARKDGSKFERHRIYLPATLYDNPDKEYVKQYEENLLDKPMHIQQAMLYGNWYVNPGSHYGDDWNPQIHVCKPFKIPSNWRRVRGMDWGFKSHGVVVWGAIDEEGTLYIEREFSFRGLKAGQVARRMKDIEKDMGLWAGIRSGIPGWADTQLWEERGESAKQKAAEFSEIGIHWHRADKRSRIKNSERLSQRLRDHKKMSTRPGIVFFETCRDCIRTIPAIPTNPNMPEEPLEGGQDHWHDAIVYLVAGVSRDGVGFSADAVEEMEDELEEPEEEPERGRFGYGGM